MNSYKTPSFNDELLTLIHQIAGLLSEMVPVGRQDGRKIIQITATAEPGSGSDLLYALCDDGSLWFIAHQISGLAGDDWRRVQDIPKDINNI